MPWPRMNALLGSNLRDGFFFFEEFSGHLSLERRGVVFLFGHNVSSVTLEGLPDCPNFWVHYTHSLGQLSFIVIPKYRRKEIGKILGTPGEYKDVEWLKGSMSAEPTHIYMKIPSKPSVSEFMGYLKGQDALMVLHRFLQMKHGRGGIT